MKSKFNLEKNVLESMIKNILLVQQAKKMRIRVPNSEIVDFVKSDPAFKDKDGNFDEEKYNEIINSYPSEALKTIENDIKQQIMTEKLKQQIVSQAALEVTEKEIQDYIKNNEIKDVDHESIRRMLLWQKQEEYFNDWYAKLREKAKVKIFIPLQQTESAEKETKTILKETVKQQAEDARKEKEKTEK
jgi:hypothetical protein